MSTPVEGWYADPAGQAPLRWWDGLRWSRDVFPPGWLPRTADWLPRARAYLLDAMVLWAISLVLLHPFHRTFTDEMVGVLTSTLLTQGGHLPGPAVLWSYGLPLLWLKTAIPGVLLRVTWDLAWLTRRGATWGHCKEGLRVADPLAPARTRLGWQRVLLRSLLLRASAPTGIGWLVVVLWPLVDEQHRSLADRAAGLVVLDEALPRAGVLPMPSSLPMP